MRIEPTIHEVVNGERGMLRGIDLCLQQECLVSAVCLMFSAIDALSALTRPTNNADTDRGVFIKWVNDYIHPDSKLRCSAEDLYAARCGVLHTYSAESRMQREGKARHLVYQWRQGPNANAARPLPTDAIVVEVESLNEGLREGIHQFLVDSQTNDEIRKRVNHHLTSLLCYAPWSPSVIHVAA